MLSLVGEMFGSGYTRYGGGGGCRPRGEMGRDKGRLEREGGWGVGPNILRNF